MSEGTCTKAGDPYKLCVFFFFFFFFEVSSKERNDKEEQRAVWRGTLYSSAGGNEQVSSVVIGRVNVFN